MNVYEPLLFFEGESVLTCVPQLATEWQVTPDGLHYYFKVREGVKFQNNETLTTQDVKYSFEMGMVEDPDFGPMWMLYEPLLDITGSRDGTYDLTAPAQVALLGHRIDDAIQCNATHVWFNLARPYEPFPQILCQMWSSVLNQRFCVEYGCWSGDWGNYTGWIVYNNPTVSPLDSPTPVMCGTGPYKLETLDYTAMYWSIVKFDYYWGGWSSPGHVPRAVVRTVSDWATRKAMFLSGDADVVDVPRANVPELLNATTGEPLEGIQCYKDLPSLSVNAFFFTFDITPASNQFGKINDYGVLSEDGIPRDFFNDAHVRKAFANCINFTMVLHDQLLDEAYQPNTFAPRGIPYVNPDQPTYGPQPNLEEARAEFDVAFGGNLKNVGFTVQLVYNTGSTVYRTICENLAFMINIVGLVYYDHRFHASAMAVDWPTYIDAMYAHELPTFFSGWLGDYADMDDFAFPFMHSSGTYAYLQGYSNSTVDALISEGSTEFNSADRQTIYGELQKIYYDDCVSLPTYSLYSRFWFRDWVHGWYYNQLYPSLRFYVLYKQADLPAYSVTIEAHCNTEGTSVNVGITVDGLSTGLSTPHTFVLNGSHTFNVPSADVLGHTFSQWSTGQTSTTITVSSGGTYTAYYDAFVPSGNTIQVPQDYKSVQAAIDAAAPGSTIIIAPGVYNESLVINKTLTIVGKLGSEPIFTGGGSGIAVTLLAGASGSVIAGITITSWDEGILINNASGCKIYDNIMSLINKDGIVLQGTSAVNNQIYSNIFQQNGVAVYLTSSAYNSTVSQNIISLSSTGLKIETSGNTICGNMFSYNLVGINMTNSDNNKIFHNTFAGNPAQVLIFTSTGNVWDDGYPSGGNYWSDQGGPDLYSGPSQNQPGSDGIVDTSYTVAIGNVDRYPLIHGAHDVGIASYTMSKTVVGRGRTLRMVLRILNYGMYDENLHVAAYANASIVVMQSVALTKGSYIIVALEWNTSSFAYGNYTMSAYSQPTSGETNTADNSLMCGTVCVGIPGDVNGDGTVDIYDAITLGNSFLATSDSRNWNANADITNDNVVDIYDAITLANNYGKTA